MTLYEYRARDCPDRCESVVMCPIDRADTDSMKRSFDAGGQRCAHGYTFKRVFDARTVTTHYHVIHAPDTSKQREFTSHNDYKRFLHDRSQEATDRTGIVHDFQPVDMNDPAVRPPDMD